MKIYVIMVTNSCTVGVCEEVCLDNDKIINSTTNKEKAISIANEYVNCMRKDILNSYNGVLPEGCKFDDDEDNGEMYFDWCRRIYDMELEQSLFYYHEWSTIEIKIYDD